MQINDTWEIEDAVSGLRLKVIPGTKQDRLHVESLTGGTAADDHPKMNRDFWFTKDGAFDGTGSCISGKRKSRTKNKQENDTMNDDDRGNTCPALENRKPRFWDRFRRFVRCPGWLPLQWWVRWVSWNPNWPNRNWHKTTWLDVLTGKHRGHNLKLGRP